MDKYKQEIYNFLIQRENFEAMLKVNNHFSMVKEELLNSFWNLVGIKIIKKVKLISVCWEVLNPPHKARGDSKMIIYKPEWKLNENHPFVGVAWEYLFTNSYYGVWSNLKSANIDAQRLKVSLEGLRQNLDFNMETDWWPMWKYGKYKFSNNDQIAYILPDRVEMAAEEYSTLLVELLSRTYTIIDEALINFK